MISTAPQTIRIDRRCGKGWEGEVGNCKRAKIKGAATLAKSAATWGAGKVVGGAVAGVAQQHGIPGPVAARIAESATQALFNTALNSKGKNAKQLATDFISESMAIWSAKDVNTPDDGIAGGDEHVKALADFALSTSASVAAQRMKRQSNALAQLLKRPEMRLDATGDVAEAVMDLTIVGALIAAKRQRKDRACKSPWEGSKGQCRRAKAKKIAVHGGEMVASWAVGKVAGGAIAQLAVAHGVPHEVAKVISESSLQALTATAIHAATHPSSPKKLAEVFVTQAAAAAAGKIAHGEVGGLTAKANPTIHSLSSLVAGKTSGIGTVQVLENHGKTLQGLISRMRGRADATDASQLTKAEMQALMELGAMGVLMAANTKKQELQPRRRTDDATPIKRILKWYGFEIGVQYLPFEKRHGRVLPAAYGHFRRTRGADGMAVDVYVGTNLASPRIFAVDQIIDGEFDEEKMIIGVDSAAEARAIYTSAMPEEFFGGMREISMTELGGYRMPVLVKADARPRRRRVDNEGTGKECGQSHISANKTCHIGSGKGINPLGKISLEKVVTNEGTPEDFKPSKDMQRLADFLSGSDNEALGEWEGQVSDKGLQKKIDLADKSAEVMKSYGLKSLENFDDKRDELLQTAGTSDFDKSVTAPDIIELHSRLKAASGVDIDDVKMIAEEFSSSEAKNWLKEAQEFDDSEEALAKAQKTYDLGVDPEFRKKYRAFAKKNVYKLEGDAADEMVDVSSFEGLTRSKETAQRLLDPDYKAFNKEFSKKADKIPDEALDLAFDWLSDTVERNDPRSRSDARPRRRKCNHECECDKCDKARKDALEALLRLDGRKIRNSAGKVKGKKCGKTYISASYKCKSHRTKDGKLTAEGKASAKELAAKERAKRGLKPVRSSKTRQLSRTRGGALVNIPEKTTPKSKEQKILDNLFSGEITEDRVRDAANELGKNPATANFFKQQEISENKRNSYVQRFAKESGLKGDAALESGTLKMLAHSVTMMDENEVNRLQKKLDKARTEKTKAKYQKQLNKAKTELEKSQKSADKRFGFSSEQERKEKYEAYLSQVERIRLKKQKDLVEGSKGYYNFHLARLREQAGLPGAELWGGKMTSSDLLNFPGKEKDEEKINELINKAVNDLKPLSNANKTFRELSSEPTKQEIKRIYRKAATKAHPDRGGSQEAMTELNEAYRQTLKRYNFDALDFWADIYLSLITHSDAKAPGKPCGNSYISRRKKCSPEKAKQTSAAIKARGGIESLKQKQRNYTQLKREVKQAKSNPYPKRASSKTRQLSLLPDPEPVQPVRRSQKNAAKRMGRGSKLSVIEGGKAGFTSPSVSKEAKRLLGAMNATDERLADLKSTVKRKKTKSSEKSLKQLFQEAEQIGAKYKEGDGPADLTARRRAKEKANDLVDKTIGQAANKGAGVANLGTPKKRHNLTNEYDKKIAAVRKIQDPIKRAEAARDLAMEVEALQSSQSSHRSKGIQSIKRKTSKLSREMFKRTPAPQPKRASAPMQVPRKEQSTLFRAPNGQYYSIDSKENPSKRGFGAGPKRRSDAQPSKKHIQRRSRWIHV